MILSSQSSSLEFIMARARKVYMAKLKRAKIAPMIANLQIRTEVLDFLEVLSELIYLIITL